MHSMTSSPVFLVGLNMLFSYILQVIIFYMSDFLARVWTRSHVVWTSPHKDYKPSKLSVRLKISLWKSEETIFPSVIFLNYVSITSLEKQSFLHVMCFLKNWVI
jgi:hypothetical protein